MSATRRSTRLRISIDAERLAEDMQLSSATTTREVIQESLQLLIRLKRQEQLRADFSQASTRCTALDPLMSQKCASMPGVVATEQRLAVPTRLASSWPLTAVLSIVSK